MFMEPPAGVPLSDPTCIWQLNKPLYGLKQAPRQWYAKLKVILLSLGFRPSQYDPSLYICADTKGHWILVYVDDLLIMASTEAELAAVKAKMKQILPLKDLGPVTDYLGMQITRDREAKEISLHQGRYIEDILRRFKDFTVETYDTPLAVNHGLTLPADDEEPIPGQDRYPELVGCLMYLMVCTRPNIAHAMSVLGRFVAPGRHVGTH